MAEKENFEDLTRRIKELEAELASCKAHINSFINNFPFVSWIKDTEGRYLYVNDHFLEFVNKPSSQVIGELDINVLPTEKVEKAIIPN